MWQCPDCRGALVEGPRVDRIKRTREQKWSEERRKQVRAEVLKHDSMQTVRCPKCFTKMNKIRVTTGAASFHLDRCPSCDAWWFDGSELELMQIQYEEKIDGRTPADWDRVERQAVAQLELDRHVQETIDEQGEEATSAAGVARSLVEAMGGGPQFMTGMVAAWACQNLIEGLAEDEPARRRWPLLMAVVGAIIVLALAALGVYLKTNG